MARTIDEIQAEMIAAIQADPTLSGLTSVSAVAIWRLFTRVVAGALETEEQINDAYRDTLEQIAREAIPGTLDWLQKRVLEFQYDALNPQVTQVIDGQVTYPTIDESLRIITRAAVKNQSNGRAIVKVAKDDGAGGLEPLAALELSSLTGYLDRIGFAGVPVDAISQQADRLRIDGLEIYYLRQYDPSAVLTEVIAAIDSYLADISTVNFNGIIVKNELIDRIQAVEGVKVVGEFSSIILREFSDPAPNGLSITVQRETAAGYAISEDEPGFTLAETITMLSDDQIPNI